jgi:hypothetical protein
MAAGGRRYGKSAWDEPAAEGGVKREKKAETIAINRRQTTAETIEIKGRKTRALGRRKTILLKFPSQIVIMACHLIKILSFLHLLPLSTPPPPRCNSQIFHA